MPFQFQLRTLFGLTASLSLGLAWYRWLDPGYGIQLWWPGWLGWGVGFGLAGALLIDEEEPPLAAEMVVMMWLLLCYHVAYSCFDIFLCESSWNAELPNTATAIWYTQLILRECFTPFVVLLPLLLIRHEILRSVLRSRIMQALFLFTVCNSLLLVLMIRYLFTRTPLI